MDKEVINLYTIFFDSGSGSRSLYVPTDTASGLIAAKLDTEVNRAGKMTLELPPGHPAELVVLKTQVFVYDDLTLLWFGRVFSIETDLYGVISVMIEGAQTFLNDVLLRPFTFTGTPGELLAYVIEKYNAGADERRLFGYEAPETDPAHGSPLLTTLKVESSGYRTAWDIIEKEILTPTGLRLILGRGKLTPAKGQQTPRVGVKAHLFDEPPDGGQEIALGKNLIEYRQEGSGEDVVTVLIPLGHTVTVSEQEHADENTIGAAVSPGNSLTGSAVETQVYNFCRQEMGLSCAAACGVLANMEAECSFNSGAIGDNGNSLGLCQWYDSRRRDLIRWCRNSGYDYTTVTGQLHYFQYDLINNYYSVYKYMKAQSNNKAGAFEAAYFMCCHYEVPAHCQQKAISRGNAARDRFFPHYDREQIPVVDGQTATAGAKYDDAEKGDD